MESSKIQLTCASNDSVLYLGRDCDIASDTDVLLCLKDGQIKTHRALLAAGCRMFERCLLSCYPHLAEEDGSAVIILPDFAVYEVSLLLNVMCGKAEEVVMSGDIGNLARTVEFRWMRESELHLEELKHECLMNVPVVKIEVSQEVEMMLVARVKNSLKEETIDMDTDILCTNGGGVMEDINGGSHDYPMEQDGKYGTTASRDYFCLYVVGGGHKSVHTEFLQQAPPV